MRVWQSDLCGGLQPHRDRFNSDCPLQFVMEYYLKETCRYSNQDDHTIWGEYIFKITDDSWTVIASTNSSNFKKTWEWIEEHVGRYGKEFKRHSYKFLTKQEAFLELL